MYRRFSADLVTALAELPPRLLKVSLPFSEKNTKSYSGTAYIVCQALPVRKEEQKRIPIIRKGKQVSPLALAILVAICLFISSGCIMLALTLLQSKDVPIAIRLLTLAVLPGPLLFLCMGLLAWVFTNSLLWAIGIGIASYIFAIATALQVQKIIVNLWNRIRRITK